MGRPPAKESAVQRQEGYQPTSLHEANSKKRPLAPHPLVLEDEDLVKVMGKPGRAMDAGSRFPVDVHSVLAQESR